MKLYIVTGAKNGTDSIDGSYYLFTEEGEVLASHWCSNISYSKSDLYSGRPERIEEYNNRFGEVEVLYLGDDDMTVDKILELNRQHAIANGYFDKKSE
jgi:hypothetical protein